MGDITLNEISLIGARTDTEISITPMPRLNAWAVEIYSPKTRKSWCHRFSSVMIQDLYPNFRSWFLRRLEEEAFELGINDRTAHKETEHETIGVFIPDIYDQFEFIELEK